MTWPTATVWPTFDHGPDHRLAVAGDAAVGVLVLADDLVRQALIRVASRWERVIAARDPEPYVRKVLYHQHVSWWRRHRRAELPTEKLTDVAVADHTANVATSLAVWQALAALAPRQRAVLILRFYEDLSEARAAEVLGCSVSTVQ